MTKWGLFLKKKDAGKAGAWRCMSDSTFMAGSSYQVLNAAASSAKWGTPRRHPIRMYSSHTTKGPVHGWHGCAANACGCAAHGQGAQLGVNGVASEKALCLKPLPPEAAARACSGFKQSASFKAPRHAVSASAEMLRCCVAPALMPPLSLMRHAPSASVSGVGEGPGGRISSHTPRGAPSTAHSGNGHIATRHLPGYLRPT